MIPERIRSFHARHPGASDRVFGRARLPGGRTSYDRLADELSGDVLDLACGDGALLARLGRSATGLDASEAELAAAAARLGPRARLVLGEAQRLPFADGSFDAVGSHMALMLMDELDRVLAEIRRVLRPGGRFAAVVGRSAEPLPLQKRFFGELHRLQPNDPPLGDARTRDEAGWRELLAGWRDVRLEDLDLAVEAPADEAWEFLELSYYPVEALEPAAKESLRARVHAELGGRPLEWRFAARLVVATAP